MMIRHYVKIAIRNLWKNREQTIICILGLVIGIVSFSLCNYVIRFLSDRDMEFTHYERLNSVYWSNGAGGSLPPCIGQARLLENNIIAGIEAVGGATFVTNEQFCFDKGDEPIIYSLPYTYVTRGFLDVLSVEWIQGNPETIFLQPDGVVISRSIAEKIYGDKTAIGRQMYMVDSDENIPENVYTVHGVIEDIPEANSFSPFETLGIFIDAGHIIPDDSNSHVWILSSPGTDSSELNSRLKEDERIRLIPEGRGGASFYPHVTNFSENRKSLMNILGTLIITFLSFLVLLASLINFFSICVGTFFNRTRELSLRKNLGAGISGPFYLLFTEMFLIVFASFIVSVVFSELMVPLINGGIPSLEFFVIKKTTLIMQELQYFPLLLLFCIILALIASLRIKKLTVIEGVKANKGANKHLFRNSMLVFQFFVSFFCMGIGAIFHLQYQKNSIVLFSTLDKKDKDRIFEIDLTMPQLKGKADLFIPQLMNHRGTEDILESSSPIYSMAGINYYEIDPDEKLGIGILKVSENFQTFFQLPLLQGQFPANSQSVLITKSLNDKLGEGQAGSIVLNTIGYQITGVIPDFINGIVDYTNYYTIEPVTETNYIYVKSYPGYEKETFDFIHSLMKEWYPSTISYEVRSFQKMINDLQQGEKAIRNIFLVLSLLLLLITGLGIYSAITVDTIHKQKEVGVRKINGAMMKDIFWLFGRLYVRLFSIAVIIGIPVVWLTGNFFLQFYRKPITLLNPVIWLVLMICLAVIILITISYRLWLIARMNPVDVIRTE